MFTQPTLSGFIIQASIFGYLEAQISVFCNLVPRPQPSGYFLLLVNLFFWLKRGSVA